MSKAETLLRIKEAEAQNRTTKEAAERERESTLREARRAALDLIETFREQAEARYRDILAAAETGVASERDNMLAAAREEAARISARGTADLDRAVELVPAKVRGKILTLELNITEEDAARKKAEALLSDLDRRIDELRPFAALELALKTYRGYGTIAVLVGHIAKEVSESDFEGVPTEVFQAPGFVAVFAPKSAADQVLGVLAKFGFTQIDIPTGEGNPEALLDEALADLEKWKARLEEIEGRLET